MENKTNFKNMLRLNEYNNTDIEECIKPRKKSKKNSNVNDKYFMKLPFINEKINNIINTAFKKRNIQICLAQRSYTLRNELSNTKKHKRMCNKRNCLLKDTDLCYKFKIVYQMMCQKCNEFYIGYTKRYLHERIKEHIQDSNSSINKHIENCQTDQSHIKVSILYQCNNVIDT